MLQKLCAVIINDALHHSLERKIVDSAKLEKPVGIYLISVWMVINVLIMALLIPGDSADLNNYIEVILWIVSIGGLLTMRKVGAALAIVVLCVTLSTSMGIFLLAYYNNLMTEPVAYINALRMILNALAIVYMFRGVFANKFK